MMSGNVLHCKSSEKRPGKRRSASSGNDCRWPPDIGSAGPADWLPLWPIGLQFLTPQSYYMKRHTGKSLPPIQDYKVKKWIHTVPYLSFSVVFPIFPSPPFFYFLHDLPLHFFHHNQSKTSRSHHNVSSSLWSFHALFSRLCPHA